MGSMLNLVIVFRSTIPTYVKLRARQCCAKGRGIGSVTHPIIELWLDMQGLF